MNIYPPFSCDTTNFYNLNPSKPQSERTLIAGLLVFDPSFDNSQMSTNCELESYKEWSKVAIDIAKAAGVISAEAFRAPKRIENKTCAQDIVTETDKAVEDFIKAQVAKAFPAHQFLGEESHVVGSGIPIEPTWIVDPIDGTNNFVHGLPMFCVSIGICVERGPVVGVVYNPITEELFHAVKGQGAYLNGQPIKVNPLVTSLEKCLLATEYTTAQATPTSNSDNLRLMQHVRGLRMFGSAALNMCYMACARVDGFLGRGVKCWDVAGATVIVREAGGFVTDYSATAEYDLCSGQVVAVTCPLVAQQIAKTLK